MQSDARTEQHYWVVIFRCILFMLGHNQSQELFLIVSPLTVNTASPMGLDSQYTISSLGLFRDETGLYLRKY